MVFKLLHCYLLKHLNNVLKHGVGDLFLIIMIVLQLDKMKHTIWEFV